MPSASRNDKLWPSDSWHMVFDRLVGHGLALLLLAGNPAESDRAQELVRAYPQANVLPRMSLRDCAGTLASATLMVGLDSGLTHLSCGTSRPPIGIYNASTP